MKWKIASVFFGADFFTRNSFKSLGGILAMQEQIARAWQVRPAGQQEATCGPHLPGAGDLLLQEQIARAWQVRPAGRLLLTCGPHLPGAGDLLLHGQDPAQALEGIAGEEVGAKENTCNLPFHSLQLA